ncbi:MAG: hypothetical protein JNN09_04005 [Alphaproteobacteria bacterium]|nr:hypothetical protein [Alphaproteobacteria bacterium]
MSHSNCHFYEIPAGSSLAALAQLYTTTVLAPIATQLGTLDKSRLRFTHKNGEWKIRPQKDAGLSLTGAFAGTLNHSITFPDFGTFVSQTQDAPNLGKASFFPSQEGVFFLACEKPLPKRLLRTYITGRAHTLHFGEGTIRMAGDHYVPTILHGITFHKEETLADPHKEEQHRTHTTRSDCPKLAVA